MRFILDQDDPPLALTLKPEWWVVGSDPDEYLDVRTKLFTVTFLPAEKTGTTDKVYVEQRITFVRTPKGKSDEYSGAYMFIELNRPNGNNAESSEIRLSVEEALRLCSNYKVAA
jgi:hypothetical protein